MFSICSLFNHVFLLLSFFAFTLLYITSTLNHTRSMASQDNWGDFKFEDTQPNSFLSLRNNIKEHICRFLPERRDLYQACLVHPQWRIAAQSVLWEHIQFEKPDNLRIFVSTISSNNMVALLVKSVQLVFIDHDDESPFPPIAKSKLDRHRPSTLSNLDIISGIASVCENITHISIYGYRLGLKDIERVSAYARNLKSLTIIGAPERVPVNLNTLLPRLTTLRLDGPFGLTPAWATSFAQKASNVSCLQFSLEGMQAATLDAICASDLHLTELTLTEATHLSDAYVRQVFKSFPRLRRFRVESCVKLTSVSIAHSVLLCPELLDLEIRARAVSSPNNDTIALSQVLDEASYDDDAVFARPTRLVLQNMSITDEELHQLSRFFTQLKDLRISGCRELTNACFQEFVIAEDFRFLQSLSVQNCPLIDSNLFDLMIKSREICQSLMHVYFDSCGEIDLHDIYQLCVHCHQENLRKIKLMHYQHLAATVLGSFNETQSKRMLLLGRRSIDALAHTTDPVLTKPVPDDIVLTGKQLMYLADRLNMTVSDLEDIIAQVKKVGFADDGCIYPCIDSSLRMDRLLYLMTLVSFCSWQGVARHTHPLNLLDANAPKACHNRLTALRAPSCVEHRPSTPAVWSHDEAKNGVIVSAPPKNRFEEDSTNQPTYQDDDDEDDEEEEEKENDEKENVGDSSEHENDNEISYDDEQGMDEDEESSSQSDRSQSSWNNNNNNNNIKANHDFHPENNLGGWGAPVNDNWATPSTSTSLSSTKTPFKEVQEEQQQQQQTFTVQNYWTSYKADAYENEWRQSPLEHVASQQEKNFTAGHYRNAPKVMESDGWGQAKDTIPWNDYDQQGFEKNIIAEQRNTDFWNQPEPGQWVVASGPSASKSSTADPRTTTPTTTLSDYRRPPKNNQARNRNRKVDSSSSDEDQYNYTNTTATTASKNCASFHGVSPTKARNRSNSVVSQDENINWDDDDNHVQIKVRAEFPPLQRAISAATASVTATNTTTNTKNREKATHWNSATEWQGKS